MAAEQIGFIGLGRMGSRMAMRLLAAQYRLAVFDVKRQACAPLLERGAELGKSPAEVARVSRIVMSCLPGPQEVEAVMEGPQGVLSSLREGSLVVEMSTISPALSRKLAARCLESGAAYIDAPISNGGAAAQTGELTFMVGGDKTDHERALPLLRHLGNRIYHMGPVGTGNVAKIANQMIYLSYVAAFCETARMARESGLDIPNFVDVMSHCVAGDPLVTGWERRLESGERSSGFRISRVLKDLQLGADVCAEHASDAPVLASVMRAYRQAAESGSMDKDMTALYSP
jgi:2-hydroxy-3-oxopropionate reductase